jgi:hypothetical protein
MRDARAPRILSRAGLIAVVALVAVSAAALAGASGTAASATVKSFSPKTGSVGTKVTFTGVGLGGVSGVTWVIYSSNPPKDYPAKFTKTASSIVATAPVAWPGNKYAGYIEMKTGAKALIVSCWGGCG